VDAISTSVDWAVNIEWSAWNGLHANTVISFSSISADALLGSLHIRWGFEAFLLKVWEGGRWSP
jgi:hypothetical protein